MISCMDVSPFTPPKHVTPLPALTSVVCIFLYRCLASLAPWPPNSANDSNGLRKPAHPITHLVTPGLLSLRVPAWCFMENKASHFWLFHTRLNCLLLLPTAKLHHLMPWSVNIALICKKKICISSTTGKWSQNWLYKIYVLCCPLHSGYNFYFYP